MDIKCDDCGKIHDIDLDDGYGVFIRCSCGARFMYNLPEDIIVDSKV